MRCMTISASDIAIALRESLAFEPRVSFWRKASDGRVGPLHRLVAGDGPGT